jgi:hypothetical protein
VVILCGAEQERAFEPLGILVKPLPRMGFKIFLCLQWHIGGMYIKMTKVSGIGKFILKVAFIGLILVWGLTMKFVGFMVCAITSGGN